MNWTGAAEFVKEFHGLILAVAGLITGGGATAGGLYLNSKKKAAEVELKSKSEIVTETERKISELVEQMTGIKNTVETQSASIEILSEMVQKLTDTVKRDQFRKEIKHVIKSSIENMVVSNADEIPKPLKSLILESESHAYEFFTNIYYTGYSNTNVPLIKERAKQVFRTLRKSREPGFSDEIANKIRDDVARNAIMMLVSRLEGLHNSRKGKERDDQDFLDTIRLFCEVMIDGAVKIYRQNS